MVKESLLIGGKTADSGRISGTGETTNGSEANGLVHRTPSGKRAVRSANQRIAFYFILPSIPFKRNCTRDIFEWFFGIDVIEKHNTV